jgi:hypothetical protein
MPLPDEIDPKSIRDQLDRWEIDINRDLADPPAALFQQEMRRRHGAQIEQWIHNLENLRNKLQPNHGHGASAPHDPNDLSPPGLSNPGDATTVAEIYSLLGYLRSEVGQD